MRRFLALLALVPSLAASAVAQTAAQPVSQIAAQPVAQIAAVEDAMPQGPSLDARIATICARVQAALAYPPLARARNVQGISLVAFEIGADGLARGIEIAVTSGSADLDRAAARGVRAAGKLPHVYGRLEIPVRFELEARAAEEPFATTP